MTADEWGKIKDTFFHRWNFPMCCGAIDGKHVVINDLLVLAHHFIIIKKPIVLYCSQWWMVIIVLHTSI